MADIAPIILFTVFLALVFDFINGANDAANSISTIVATRVLSPTKAVIWAAFFNFAAFWVFQSTEVSKTMSRGVIDKAVVDNDNYFILCALLGAITWGWLCTKFGLPISISHTLIGGLVGPALVKAGPDSLLWFEPDHKGLGWIGVFIIIAPFIGLMLSYLLQIITLWVFRSFRPNKVDGFFKFMQLISSAAFSLGHGSNDAQKTAGIIILLLASGGHINMDEPPQWIFYSCYIVIGLGTLIGGWKVVKTMGHNLTPLKPMGGFCAETAGAFTLFGTAALGIPASTTHTITGAIMGVGAAKRFSAVRWQVVSKIVWAWILTIPATIIMSGFIYWIVNQFV
ncbi:MAG: anion permease [Chitinophagales bacterium]